MNALLRRTLTTAGATAGALAVLTGTALAHDCYLGTPNLNAPKAPHLITISVAEFAAFGAQEGMVEYDPECADVDAGYAALREAGLPLQYRIFDRVTVAANAPQKVLSNGKGVDNFHYGPPVTAITTFADAAMVGCQVG